MTRLEAIKARDANSAYGWNQDDRRWLLASVQVLAAALLLVHSPRESGRGCRGCDALAKLEEPAA